MSDTLPPINTPVHLLTPTDQPIPGVVAAHAPFSIAVKIDENTRPQWFIWDIRNKRHGYRHGDNSEPPLRIDVAALRNNGDDTPA